jgi:hypothetical protein
MLAIGYGAFAFWLVAFPFMWILRDGLGPDARETSGWEAFWKFLPMIGTGQAIVAITALAHVGAWWLQRRIDVKEQSGGEMQDS